MKDFSVSTPTGDLEAHRVLREAILCSARRLHCTGCGRSDVFTTPYACSWPDATTTLERHCDECASVWQRQLVSLGVKVRLCADAAGGSAVPERAPASASLILSS
jgi:hypothetical protein